MSSKGGFTLPVVGRQLEVFNSKFVFIHIGNLTARNLAQRDNIGRCFVVHRQSFKIKINILSQPFPALQLTLEENGKTVASQIIQPRQYLPENMKMLTRLATKTPYPIEFTIKTRRSEIEGYTLKPQYQ
ncbi:MAG: DUF3426 domain-containing protein [Moraxellaceae bacterium]|nr:MAG: DUF3426 domain-containing protein [Moraxellaceae bacterium]